MLRVVAADLFVVFALGELRTGGFAAVDERRATQLREDRLLLVARVTVTGTDDVVSLTGYVSAGLAIT